MKNHFLLPALFIAGIVTISSCKKDKKEDAINPSSPSCMIDYSINGNDSTRFTYDNENRIVKIQSFDKTTIASQYYSEYNYSNNKITEKQYDEKSVLSYTGIYILNSDKTVQSGVIAFDSNVQNNDSTWYTYNENQRLIKEVSKNSTFDPIKSTVNTTYDSTLYTYTNNNLTRKDWQGNGGTTPSITSYNYGTDNANDPYYSINYGKGNEKLAVSKTNGAITETYLYEFNSDKYVTRVITKIGGDVKEEEYYQYTCK